MQLKTSCPNCTASLSVNSELVGNQAKCPRCQTKFVVEDVRTPTSPHSLDQAAEATETIAEQTTSLISGTKSSPPNTPAAKMLGRFELRKVLGQGGFGRVYQAYDPQLDRLLALKVPTFGPQDAKKARRFQDEAKAAAQLRHPNIVPTFESGKIGNQFFIASQFIDGEPMSAITKAGRTKGRQAAEWIAKLARALAYAHEMGIVHRDVKPHNVMLDERGEPQLMDFGLAKRLNDDSGMTADGALLGTPAYMAPEQARGDLDNVGAHSDQYALGAMLYELLTGQRSFDGAPHAVMAKILSEEPPAPRSLVPQIPRDLEAITQKAMSKEISRRYASCDDFADDLDRWLAGDPIVARPMTRQERVMRWAKRNRSIAVALGSLMAAFVLVGVIGILAAGYQAYAARQVRYEKQKALDALDTAQSERDRADKEKEAAQSQKSIAERHQAEAEKQQRVAVSERELARQAAETNRKIAYSAHMNLGQQAWDEGAISFLHNLLERYFPQPGQPDLRSFEWHYWWRMSHGYRLRIDIPGGNVSDVAFSPDGQMIATSSDDLQIRLWNADTGELRYELPGNRNAIFCMTFSPDRRWLAAGGDGGQIRLWNVETGQLWKTLSGQDSEVTALSFSPSGTTILAVGSTITSWNIDAEQANLSVKDILVRRFHTSNATIVAISPDRGSVVASGDHGLTAWDVSSDKSRTIVSGDGYKIRAVAFSPDGKTLASGGWDNMVRFWNFESGKEIHTCAGHTNHIFDMAFAPDGKSVASAGRDSTVRVWDAGSGQLLSTLKGHSGRISTIAFSSDGKTLASGGRDATLVLWESPSTPRELVEFQHERPVQSLAFSPDGRTLASAGAQARERNSAVRLWDLEANKEIANFPHPGVATIAVFSLNGTALATLSTDQNVRVWDFTSRALVRTFPAPSKGSERGGCRGLCYSPDGTLLAAPAENGSVNLWDAAEGVTRTSLPGDGPNLTSVCFSPDGEFLAAGSLDQTVKVWRVSDRQRLMTLQGHRDYVWSVGFSKDGKTIASASRDATVNLWDLATAKLRTPLTGHTDTVQWLAMTPDGKTLATTGGDQNVKLWDVATGELKSTLKGLTDYAYCVAFAPDGRTMATGSRDGRVRLWRTASDADVQVQRSQPRKKS